MKRLCVYCGSSPGKRPEYALAARKLGQEMARQDIDLVYGGGKIGIMGIIATTVLEEGGVVTCVIPKDLVKKEVAFTSLTNLRVVATIHERKALMTEMSDGFIALPGGLGPLEEFFEVLTWAQLGMHQKPCGLINACGYFDQLTRFLDHTVEEQFVEPEHRAMLLVDEDPAALLNKFRSYEPPEVDKAAWALGMSLGNSAPISYSGE